VFVVERHDRPATESWHISGSAPVIAAQWRRIELALKRTCYWTVAIAGNSREAPGGP